MSIGYLTLLHSLGAILRTLPLRLDPVMRPCPQSATEHHFPGFGAMCPNHQLRKSISAAPTPPAFPAPTSILSMIVPSLRPATWPSLAGFLCHPVGTLTAFQSLLCGSTSCCLVSRAGSESRAGPPHRPSLS